jgi:hypothetical protein
MTTTPTKLFTHLATVALCALALVVFARGWLPAQLFVGVLGISSGVLTAQVMWDEFWHGPFGAGANSK